MDKVPGWIGGRLETASQIVSTRPQNLYMIYNVQGIKIKYMKVVTNLLWGSPSAYTQTEIIAQEGEGGTRLHIIFAGALLILSCYTLTHAQKQFLVMGTKL